MGEWEPLTFLKLIGRSLKVCDEFLEDIKDYSIDERNQYDVFYIGYSYNQYS